MHSWQTYVPAVGACASGEEWEVKLRDASDVKEGPQGRPRSTGKRVTGRE